MNKIIVPIFMCILFINVAAQDGTLKDGEPIAIGFNRTMYSSVLKENRELYISLPSSYATAKDKRYPLYLTLDAQSMFNPAASMIRSLSSAGVIPEMIVVSIKSTDRWRDLTPTAEATLPTSGGGERFLESVSKEILPFLEKNWRVGDFTVFSGHSLGGLMTFHSFATGSSDFDAFVALSPTLAWEEKLFGRWMRNLKERKSSDNKLLYLAISNEKEDRPYFDKVNAYLIKKDSSGFEFQAEWFDKTDDHHSVRVPSELAAIRWIFKDYNLLPRQIYQMSDEQIAEHYRKASKTYKQKLEFDIMQMTNAAYFGLSDKKYQSRAMALFKLAVKKWSSDAYAWSCLAEAYERTGDLKNAQQASEKSVKLGKENNFQDMPYLEGILNRIKSKLQR